MGEVQRDPSSFLLRMTSTRGQPGLARQVIGVVPPQDDADERAARTRSAVIGRSVTRAPAAATALAIAGATVVLVSSPTALAPSGPGPDSEPSSTTRSGGVSTTLGSL